MDFGQKVSIFRDEQHTRQFQQEGYVVLPLLEATDVAALRAHYEQFHPQGVKGFYSTTFAPEEAHRQAVDQTIRQVCTPAIDRYFHDYKALFSSFIAKAPGADSALAMHQDMTLLDETVYTGTNIWCPLIDLNEQNGAIAVLPRSHRLFFTYRGATLPDIYDGEVERLLPLMKPFHLKAGEAIVFDQSIIHWSPPNLSEAERPVVNTFIA
ncbi:MAG: phytanoyl-CoA dioxygenase family protein, partial [Bacteroidota bacterium]